MATSCSAQQPTNTYNSFFHEVTLLRIFFMFNFLDDDHDATQLNAHRPRSLTIDQREKVLVGATDTHQIKTRR